MTPSPLVYEAGMQCLRLHSEIFENPEAKELFLSFKNPRDIFALAFELQVKNSKQLGEFFDQQCLNNHSFINVLSSIGKYFYNCISKNVASEWNSKIHAAEKRPNSGQNRSTDSRKIAKLSSAPK